MLNLASSASANLSVVTSAAGTVEVQCSYVDFVSGTVTPSSAPNLSISTATTTSVIAGVAATVRNIKSLVVRNAHASISNNIEVRVTDGTTVVRVWAGTLLAGESVVWTDAGWVVLSYNGVPSTASVSLTGAQIAILAGLPVNLARDYGAKFDHRVLFDGACSTGAPTKITSATAAFVAADLGKRILLTGAGASGAKYIGTITNIDSTSQVSVSPSISTTVSSKAVQIHTDDLAAWTSFISDANGYAKNGVDLQLPHLSTNRSGVSAVLPIIRKPMKVTGIGCSFSHDTGDYATEGSCLVFCGASSVQGGVNNFSAFVTFDPTNGATGQALIGPVFQDFWIDCRNGDQDQALYGLEMRSCRGYELSRFFINDALASSLLLGVTAPGTPGALGEAKDCARGSIGNFRSRQLDNTSSPVAPTLTATTTTSAITLTTSGQSMTLAAANGLTTTGWIWVMTANGYPVLVNYTGGGGSTTLTGCTVSLADSINAPTTVSGSNVVQATPANGACAVLDGDATANTNLSLLEMWQLSHGTTWGPAAVEYRNCDSLQGYIVVINGGNATNDGAINRIRKPGVRFNGSTTNVTLAARNNTLDGGDCGVGGVSAMGLLNTGAKLAFPSGPNYWLNLQLANAAPVPNQESFSAFMWSPNGGMIEGGKSALIADQTISAATLTQVNGSQLVIPPQGFQVGTKIRWVIDMAKSAAGVAARSLFLRVGTAGTTADTALATVTLPLGTAVVDQGKLVVEWTIQTIGAAATSRLSTYFIHQLTATGFMTVAMNYQQITPSTFNTVTSGITYAALSFTTGAAEVLTILQASVEVVNPSNP